MKMFGIIKRNGKPKALRVDDFGASGNNVADDTLAIQSAMNEASATGKTLIFSDSKVYKITSALNMKSNLHISGYGAKLFMASSESQTNMMITTDSEYVENVSIKGLAYESVNDKAGTGYGVGALVSNVSAMHFTGITGLIIEDVSCYNMNNGLKFGVPAHVQINENITVNNLNIYDSLTPILMNTVNTFNMLGGILDASQGKTEFLHCIYIDKDCSNITLDGVLFRKSPGSCVHIYNGYTGTSPASNVNIINSQLEDSRVGFIIFSGANNINILNTTIKRADLAFSISSAYDVTIDNVAISEATNITAVPKGAFRITNMYRPIIKNLTIECAGMTENLFNIYENFIDAQIDNVVATNVNDIELMQSASNAVVTNLLMENSRFNYTALTFSRVKLRNPATTALFRNNEFLNSGSKISSLFYNFTNTGITLQGNEYSGLTSLVNSGTDIVLIDNVNLTP